MKNKIKPVHLLKSATRTNIRLYFLSYHFMGV